MNEFISKLKQQSVYISLQDDDSLKVSFNGKKLDNTLLNELKAKKQELIAYLKANKSSSARTYKLIPKVEVAESYKLSSGQLRLWLLNQRKDGALVYNEQGQIYFKEALNVSAFAKAIDAAIDRHEILRTVFKENAQGEVRQWVLDRAALNFAIDYKDLRQYSDRRSLAVAYISEDVNKGFDLEVGPLFRVALLQMEDEEYIFHFTMHHIISDGWSMDILSKDVFLFYNAFKNNNTPELNSLPIQYKDYAAWLSKELESETFKVHKSYWLDRLSGELPILNLPSSKRRPAVRTHDGRCLTTCIDTTTTQQLKSFTKANSGSLFMSLLAMWNVLMYRYTSGRDVITGTIVSGREHADLSEQLGFYVNTLALRNSINPEESFIDFYKRLKSNTLNAYRHQMYPFDRLIEDLDLKGNLERNLVFDVTLVYQSHGQNQFDIVSKDDNVNQVIDNGSRKVEFDLQVTFREVGDSLAFIILYNSSVYEKEMVERLMQHYRQLVINLLESPEKKLSDIDYLLEEEKKQLLVDYNATKQGVFPENSINERFSNQAALYPERVAVCYKGVSLSYSELEARSNQLANYLRERGVGQGNLVGLLLDRSEEMVVGILGVLKSGAGYVPIDPSLPAQRISYMLSQSEATFLLSTPSYTALCSSNLPLISIDDCSIWSSSSVAYDVDLDSQDPAYCIFTSGSSGKPKGVLMGHGSVLSLVWGLEKTVYRHYKSGLRVGLLASYAFDASVQQIFGSLLLGHSLYIADDASRKDGCKLLDFYNRNKISISDGTPTHLRLLLNSLDGKPELPNLKAWILAGEYLDKALVERFYDSFPSSIDMYNFYGPTETCVDSTYFKIIPSELAKHTTIPIGVPLPNERVYVVDSYGSIVAHGVVGELCIAGVGLGIGYAGNEKLTSERFANNWVSGEERVYRTGDLVRWLPDGNLEYYGRMDDQIKLRGYRIELEEIANVLKKYEVVEDTVVLLKGDEPEDRHLVAYIVPSNRQGITVSNLYSNKGGEATALISSVRVKLSQELPDYMMPSDIVLIDKIPLTTNGKLDRGALSPKYTKPQEGAKSEMEESLVAIWSEVLKLLPEQVGVTSDFFELGGHSLNGIQIANAINRRLGVDLKLVEIFKRRTIREIAELIEMNQWLGGESKKVKGKEAVI